MKKLSFVLLFLFASQISFAQEERLLDIATQYLQENAKELNLKKDDFSEFVVTDSYKSAHNGISHIYLLQKYEDMEVYNAIFNVNILSNEKVLNYGNRFVSDLKSKVNTTVPQITAKSAVNVVIEHFKVPTDTKFELLNGESTNEGELTFLSENIAAQPITARLVYQPHSDGSVRLTWMVELYEKSRKNWWNARVDAVTSEIIASDNRVIHCSFGSAKSECVAEHNHAHPSTAEKTNTVATNTVATNNVSNAYNVYPIFVENPFYGDRQLIVAPADEIASPFGWHDTDGVDGHEYTITRGNNVHVYQDMNDINSSSGDEPDGGDSLFFDFSTEIVIDGLEISLPSKPSGTNIFYWNNLMHDVFYRYGFDENAGNFQENNYNSGGLANDAVISEFQDRPFLNQAFFSSTSDGVPPIMISTIWATFIDVQSLDLSDWLGRDGAFDNGIVAHEYAHGISGRLTGGPNSPLCVLGDESPSEGWSDWLALVMTTNAEQIAEDKRSIGSYVSYKEDPAKGFREYPYTTDMNVNPHTYKDAFDPSHGLHDIGQVWCAMLWDLYWNFRDEYGYDSDIYAGTGGNNIVIQLVIDGMKLQPCNPTFIDARDAILAADMVNNEGANQCLIWQTFARRGLGLNAQAGGTESFFTDAECATNLVTIEKTRSKELAYKNDTISYALEISNFNQNNLEDYVITDILPEHTTYVAGSSSCGGTVDNGILTITLDSLPGLQHTECTYSLQVSEGNYAQIETDYKFNNGLADWTLEYENNNWEVNNENPYNGNNSVMVTTVEDYNTTEQLLILSEPYQLSSESPAMGFWHDYNFIESLQGGAVEMRFDGEGEWADMGEYMIVNGYNGRASPSSISVLNGEQAFVSSSEGYLYSLVDLRDFAGSTVELRFRFSAAWSELDNFPKAEWFINEIQMITNLTTIENTACVTDLDNNENCANVATALFGTSTVSVENVDAHNIELYPNPTTGEFALQVPEIIAQTINVSLYSSDGRLLKTDNFQSDDTYIGNLKAFGSGVYFVELTSGDFHLTRKVVKY